MKHTLLLNSTYEALSFVTEKRAFKLLVNNKVEILASWNDEVNWYSGYIKHPAILKLKQHVKIKYVKSVFSRKALIKRDNSTCQFCNKKLTPSQITIDHIIPKSHGGENSFTNCVISCQSCNNIKANRTPEQAGMVLLRKPINPTFCMYSVPQNIELWHEEWYNFIVI